ncbi:MAG: hypothetical protein EPN85_09970 [Bacteroidetes bacterium]|nr:MAG: hypothetical protein EPN85_09970 [Bacteroidota bacterium]
MNVNKNNCESFFLDYYEKNLSPVGVAEVLFFLEENPELKDVFESYEAVFLEHERVNFPDKESLKKKYSKEELDVILSSDINRSTCEQFFIANAENILSEAQIHKLDSFLAQHPELKHDFDLFQKCKLTADKISFEHKDLLKKETVNARNREEYFIRAIENDLSAAEQKKLVLFLQKNPDFKKELDLFKQTILIPEKIPFGFKSELKKRERNPVFVTLNPSASIRRNLVEGFFQQRTYYAAAAAILLLAGLFFFFRSDDNKAVYLANIKTVNAKPEKENLIPVKKEQASTPQKIRSANNNGDQAPPGRNISVNKNSRVPQPQVKEETTPDSSAILPESKTEDALLAKKAGEKKSVEVQIEAPVVAVNITEKKDSLASALPVPNEALASAASAQAKEDEYQTFASVANKKIRAILGIKKSTECEASDRIDLWDLAIAAKNGVQKVIGVKILEVQKVCDGKGENVEYVFTAGNFELTTNPSK